MSLEPTAAAASMQDAKENNYTALFEEHEYHGFVQSVLAAMEYQSFYRLMLTAAAPGRGSCRGGPEQRGAGQRMQSCTLANKRSTSSSDSDTGSIGAERESDEDDRGGTRIVRK